MKKSKTKPIQNIYIYVKIRIEGREDWDSQGLANLSSGPDMVRFREIKIGVD